MRARGNQIRYAPIEAAIAPDAPLGGPTELRGPAARPAVPPEPGGEAQSGGARRLASVHGGWRGTSDGGGAEGVCFPQRSHGQREHRVVGAQRRVGKLESRGMNPYRHATGARGQIVARERPLPPLIQLAVSIERQRMRGNHRTATQHLKR